MRSPMAIAPTNEDCRGQGKHKKLIVCKLIIIIKRVIIQRIKLRSATVHKRLLAR